MHTMVANILKDSLIVQVLMTHCSTLAFSVGLVQMHVWSVGAQSDCVMACTKHSNYFNISQDMELRAKKNNDVPHMLARQLLSAINLILLGWREESPAGSTPSTPSTLSS